MTEQANEGEWNEENDRLRERIRLLEKEKLQLQMAAWVVAATNERYTVALAEASRQNAAQATLLREYQDNCAEMTMQSAALNQELSLARAENAANLRLHAHNAILGQEKSALVSALEVATKHLGYIAHEGRGRARPREMGRWALEGIRATTAELARMRGAE